MSLPSPPETLLLPIVEGQCLLTRCFQLPDRHFANKVKVYSWEHFHLLLS